MSRGGFALFVGLGASLHLEHLECSHQPHIQGRGKLSYTFLLPKKIVAFAGQRVVALSAGFSHTLATAADGSVWSWGSGGGLGHGVEESQLLPKKIEAQR